MKELNPYPEKIMDAGIEVEDIRHIIWQEGYEASLTPEQTDMELILSEKTVTQIITDKYNKMGCTSFSPIVDMRVLRPVLEEQINQYIRIQASRIPTDPDVEDMMRWHKKEEVKAVLCGKGYITAKVDTTLDDLARAITDLFQLVIPTDQQGEQDIEKIAKYIRPLRR